MDYKTIIRHSKLMWNKGVVHPKGLSGPRYICTGSHCCKKVTRDGGSM